MPLIASAGFANGYHYVLRVEAPLEISVSVKREGYVFETHTSTIKGALEWINEHTNHKGYSGEDI